MATYAELYNLKNNSDLNNKLHVAVVAAAKYVFEEDPGTPNHANRLTWAQQAIIAPQAYAQPMTWAVLVANSGATPANIVSATDAQIQSNVNAVIDLFAGSGA